MWRRLRRQMPEVRPGKLFSSFLKVVPACEHCGEEMHHHRADDLPAYLVVVIVGHIVVGAFMGVEATEHAVDLAASGHLGAAHRRHGASACCSPVKGAVVGLQWALYMHGFGGEDEALETHPEMSGAVRALLSSEARG